MMPLLLAALAACCLLAMPAEAQPRSDATPQQTFTLPEALAYAVDHYPSVRTALEQVNVSMAGVDAAKAASLPRLDSAWQFNRATVNNVTGLLLPQPVFTSVSGPPQLAASAQSVFGMAAGALLTWEPLDLGLRASEVRSAEASVTRARAEAGLTRLEVQGAVGAAFLAVVLAEQAMVTAQADAERRAVLARAARALSDNQLRPGAEASRADAELAAAQTRHILSRQAVILAQVTLGRVLGLTDGMAGVNATSLVSGAASDFTPAAASSAHPLLQTRRAAVDEAHTREEVLADTNRPRLFLQSAVQARGSGAAFNGTLSGDPSGLWFDRANWAVGAQVVFPNLFEVSSLRARRAAAAAASRAEGARLEEATIVVSSQLRAAAAMVDAARAVAANTPVQLSAARQSEAQARARYDAGLASIVEVADAQNLLAQAEYQDGAARVEIWRALLALAVARGDLTPLSAVASFTRGAP